MGFNIPSSIETTLEFKRCCTTFNSGLIIGFLLLNVDTGVRFVLHFRLFRPEPSCVTHYVMF